MTEATGAGAGIIQTYWTIGYIGEHPSIEVAIDDDLVRIESGAETIYVNPSRLDWLIDTLVLAKEQVQGE